MIDEVNIDVLCHVMQRVYKMKIAVCDDEKYFRDDVKNAVYKYSNLNQLEVVVDEYDCGEELLKSADEYDMILLDYRMGGIDGLETAKIIREKNIKTIIIFMTNYPDFVYESFEIMTYRFLPKPLDATKFFKALDDYFKAYGNNYPLLLKVNRSTIHINIRDIVYLEANRKKCYIYLNNKRYHCAKPMSYVIEYLPKSIFYKVHKSFVVNFDYVQSYDNKDIQLKNGASAHLSRSFLMPFRNAYKTYTRGCDI